jgi:DNA-directed RNA polymerase subunit RPC12/RpoP
MPALPYGVVKAISEIKQLALIACSRCGHDLLTQIFKGQGI